MLDLPKGDFLTTTLGEIVFSFEYSDDDKLELINISNLIKHDVRNNLGVQYCPSFTVCKVKYHLGSTTPYIEQDDFKDIKNHYPEEIVKDIQKKLQEILNNSN
ncbi:MAG: hypothetical protein PUB15_07570 [Ruminobacter sp.]|nr:hypothetical protein [Ruminobacter sp.]